METYFTKGVMEITLTGSYKKIYTEWNQANVFSDNTIFLDELIHRYFIASLGIGFSFYDPLRARSKI